MKPTKTILHMIDTTGPGGAETVFLELAKITQQQGYRSIALIRGSGWVQSQLNKLEIEHHIIDSKGSMNHRFLRALINLIKVEQVDIIQSHLFGSAIYACLAGFLCRRPVFSTIHGLVDISPNERAKLLKLFVLRIGARNIIAVTDKIRALLQSQPLLSHRKISTIYNGIETSSFQKKESRIFREKIGITQEELLVGSLGNIREPKNYPLGIETIAKLHDQGIKAHYVIAGQGSDQQIKVLADLAEHFGIKHYIHLLGFIDDASAFLSELDLFLMSSSSEGHPLALTQAMINRLPIVTTPSGVEEILEQGIDGEISTSHSSDELAECIKRLHCNKAYSIQLTENAYKKANELFSLESMCSNYLQMYSGH